MQHWHLSKTSHTATNSKISGGMQSRNPRSPHLQHRGHLIPNRRTIFQQGRDKKRQISQCYLFNNQLNSRLRRHRASNLHIQLSCRFSLTQTTCPLEPFRRYHSSNRNKLGSRRRFSSSFCLGSI
jgi:hypothetical protein